MKAVLTGRQSILVNQSGPNVTKLNNLTDVTIADPQDGDVLEYDAVSGVFKNTTYLAKQRIDCGEF